MEERGEGKQGKLSSHHGPRLWTFFTAGEQMKWNQMERERGRDGEGTEERCTVSAGGRKAAEPPAKSLLTLKSLVCQPLL